MSKPESEEVLKMIDSYSSARKNNSFVEMKIVLKDDIPIYQRPTRIPWADQAVVDKQVKEWLVENIIQPSTSSMRHPLFWPQRKMARSGCDVTTEN